MAQSRIGLKLLCVGVIVGVIAYTAWDTTANHAVDAEEAKARKAGLWTQTSDISNRPGIPDAENAAILYQPLCATFDRDADSIGHMDWGSDREVDANYRVAEPFIKQFIEAAKRPDCQFQRNWSNLAAVTVPEYSPMRTVAKLCAAEALSLSRKGKPMDGLRLLEDIAPMAHHVGTDPLIISELIQIAFDSTVMASLQDILGVHALEPGVIEEARTIVQRLGAPPKFDDALRGECAQVTSLFKSGPMLKDFFGENQKFLAFKARFEPVRDQWEIRTLHRFEEVHQVLTQPGLTPKDQLSRITDINQKYLNDDISGMLWFGDTAMSSVVADLTRREVFRAYLDCLESWRKTGKAPTALPTGNPPYMDPRSGLPIKFVLVSGGFKVWGLGLSGQDYGGTAKRPGGLGSEGDTLFEYPYVAPVPAKKTAAPQKVKPAFASKPLPPPKVPNGAPGH